MHTTLGTAVGAAIFACLRISSSGLAVTEREKRDCHGDYKTYCSEYGLGTDALRACMSRNIKKISHVCVGALVDAGDMTKAQADKLRGGKTTKKKPTAKKKITKKSTSKKRSPARREIRKPGAASRRSPRDQSAYQTFGADFLNFAASSEPLVASPAV